jgi:integrase
MGHKLCALSQALLKEVARALTEAAEKLQRNAAGDYRPDLTAERFPKWKGIQASRPFATAADASLEAIFDKWVAEAAPAPSTITTWRSYVNQLREHVGHNDARRITRADLLTWKDALVAKGRAPKGINGGQLAAVRSIFNYAVSNDIFSENPALGVSVRQRKKAGAKMQPYTDQEVARLLRLADKESSVYRSWLPWLMALSGARAGELAQLWGRRIIEVDGVRVKKIAPAEDGGTLKNEGSERDVPIHREILDRGFLDFVRSRGEGPLFYKGIRAKSAPLEAPGRRHASKGVVNHLAEWVRENGFTDPRKAPNHALRHWFKSASQRADIQDSIADAIQGHKGSRGEADAYRHADVLTMARAIARIKVPEPTGSEAELTSHGNQPGAVRG